MSSGNPSEGGDDRLVDPTNDRRDDEGPSSLGSDRGGPTTLQGLLRRLGADIGDIFPGNVGTSHSRLQQLRNSIVSPDSDQQQLEALTELCEFLSVGTEESLVSFSVNLFVSPLVNLLRAGSNVEIKIMAARALTHMMEALPSSSSSIAMNGAAGPLCENLLSIEYIDLAEQSLSALHKLSADYPQQIVSANGFRAVLSFIDFFSLGVQRVAAATACNLCRIPRSDAMDMITGVLHNMLLLLSSDDQRIRESGILGFTRLAEAFKTTADKLEALCGEDYALIEKILGLIVPPSPPSLSPQHHSSAIRLLAVLARGSADLGLKILSMESLIIKVQSKLSSSSATHSQDCLNLADSLLPDIPEVEYVQGSTTRSRRRRSLGNSTPYAAADAKRREQLGKDTIRLLFYGEKLFHTLMKFYVSSAETSGRRTALSIISKYIAIAPQSVLKIVIEDGPVDDDTDQPQSSTIQFCPFVATLLGENSTKSEALVGLAMTASALQKLPTLKENLVREGVVHEIVRLADQEDQAAEGDDSTARDGIENTSNPDGVSTHGQNEHFNIFSNAVNMNDMNSVWTAVAALQRGSFGRSRDSGSHRLPRSILDMRSSNAQSIRALVPKAAKSLLTTYLGANSEGMLNADVLRNSTLRDLSEICEELRQSAEGKDEHKGHEAFSRLLKLVVASEGLTVFEVSKSGVMTALAAYLSSSDEQQSIERISRIMDCFNESSQKSIFAYFVNLSLGVLSSQEKLVIQTHETSHSSSSNSVSSGLRQLAQPFKLRLRRAPADEGGSGLRDYSHHVVLIEPLATMASVQEFLWPKVRDLGSASGPSGGSRFRSPSLRSHVRIASDDEDEEPDIGDSRDDDSDRNESLEEDRFAEMFEVGGDNQDDDEVMDEEDGGRNSEPSDDEVSSGEEDVIGQSAGDNDSPDPASSNPLDVDQLGTSLPAYEVDHESLGRAPTRQGLRSEGRASGSRLPARLSSDISRGETTFRSYAAALAANTPLGGSRNMVLNGSEGNGSNQVSGNNGRRSRRAPTPKRLSFSLNGKTLSHECSILSAVLHSAVETRGISQSLWHETHTLVYSKHTSDDTSEAPAVTRASDANRRASFSGVLGPVRRSQRLQGNRERRHSSSALLERKSTSSVKTPTAPLSKISINGRTVLAPPRSEMAGIPESVSTVLEVLRVLHWMHTKMSDSSWVGEFLSNPHSFLDCSVKVDFISRKLSAKLLRQLSDPLALCGGAIPDWCFSLTREAAFLIPFETRRVLFQSTALGVSRALHLLQTRTDIAGLSSPSQRSARSQRESEARIGRIQRQKVRVYRSRILESAIKVMNMYSSHSTVLEVEYFDEVGTGLGPTLEFYTLASREIQRTDLGLWRGTSSGNNEPKSTSNENLSSEVIGSSRMGLIRANPGRRRSRRNSNSTMPTLRISVPHDADDPPEYVTPTGSGLFPACLPITDSHPQSDAAEKTTVLFGFVGKLLGKAMIDGRLLDLRFSSIFSRLLLAYCRAVHELVQSDESGSGAVSSGGSLTESTASRDPRQRSLALLEVVNRDRVWDLFTSGTSAFALLRQVDPQLASSLKAVMDLIERNESGSDVSDLCLTFVLPGDDSIELVKNGKDIEVNNKNAEEFVKRVTYHVLFGGVFRQTEALLSGLGALINITSLLAFESRELELLICGPPYEKWNVDFLVQATRCDHGYSHESRSVLYLLRILSELDEKDQQRFVLFTTGSPALPIGGLKSLHPRLTIVRRTPEGGRSPDECLPTVMTCTNYFKLPEYSSYEIAKKQVMLAVREGQRSFHLS